jgi:hypothetical protein
MDGMTVDVSDVLAAAAELGAKGAAAVDAIEPVMKRGAQNIKTEMQQIFGASKHFRSIARDVSYDRIGLLSGTLGYEIGPTPDGDAGSLAGIAVEGGANGGGGTVDIQPALDHEAPRLEAEIQIALGLL